MTAPRDVAVIVPAFRAAHTIDYALRSVAEQTEAPAKVVVTDDGSDDETADVARRWADRLPIRVIEQANCGPAAARRSAINACDEPLLALLDADDAWMPDHLASLRSLGIKPGVIGMARPLLWRAGSSAPPRPWRRFSDVPPPDAQQRRILKENFVFIGSAFTRSDYDAAGGFRDGYSAAEDWDLWIRMLRLGTRVQSTREPTYLYRVTGSTLSTGARVHATYVRVIETAMIEEPDPEMQAVLRRRQRWFRGRARLGEAMAAAREGRPTTARLLAVKALGSGPRIGVRAVIVACAPIRGSRFLERVHQR